MLQRCRQYGLLLAHKNVIKVRNHILQGLSISAQLAEPIYINKVYDKLI